MWRPNPDAELQRLRRAFAESSPEEREAILATMARHGDPLARVALQVYLSSTFDHLRHLELLSRPQRWEGVDNVEWFGHKTPKERRQGYALHRFFVEVASLHNALDRPEELFPDPFLFLAADSDLARGFGWDVFSASVIGPDPLRHFYGSDEPAVPGQGYERGGPGWSRREFHDWYEIQFFQNDWPWAVDEALLPDSDPDAIITIHRMAIGQPPSGLPNYQLLAVRTLGFLKAWAPKEYMQVVSIQSAYPDWPTVRDIAFSGQWKRQERRVLNAVADAAGLRI